MSNMFATSLTCTDVAVRAGRREVVAPFSWSHAPGGIAWLFGSNGSGKSSLLRVFAGWQRPARGSVKWRGAKADGIRYWAPVMSVAPELRVRHFVDFVTSISSESDSTELQALWPQLADEDNRFRNLSTGETKRILLWSLFGQTSGPLILDEPYEHLSRDAKSALTDLLRRRAETAVVVVATNQDVPISSLDTTLSLNGSRLEVEYAV